MGTPDRPSFPFLGTSPQATMRCLFFLIASTFAVAFAFGIPADVAVTALNATSADVVNTDCPVSAMPVKAGMEVETKSGDIGVCCAKCQTAVAAWSDDKKAEYVASFSQKAEEAKPEAKEAPAWDGEPYLLSTCAASGRPIEVKGTPTTKVVDGRELKFCCGGCADVVAKDPAKWLEKVDAAQVAAQTKIYPTETCCVSGEPLMEKAEDGTMKFIGENVVVKNRLFRVCCKMCAKALTKEPAKYAMALNAEVMKTQGDGYAIGQCVVNEKGSVDTEKAKSFIIGGRLIKTCCGSCEKAVRKEPAKYTAMVDAAIEAKRAKFRGEAVK